ncbi:ADP-ribosylglycohydrolase family protein [Chamaesiphon sp.]|uniref:ADP-ribosylglycohydrolase family protein n=1 Tax=Chamaesiphon sp. TaxID=2814140 RepID=UPI003592F14C
MMKSSKILAGLMGLSVGDALGVPVEFQTREELAQKPVVDMYGQNCWSERPGT